MKPTSDYDTFKGQKPGSDKGAFRSGPGASPVTVRSMPSLPAYMFLPWLCTLFIMLWALLFHGMGFLVIILPVLALCCCAGVLAYSKYRHELENLELHQHVTNSAWPQINLLLLILVACLVAGIVTLITYFHFYAPYDQLGGGATYLNMLPSQAGLAASDATAIMFAEGTQVDTKRSYGFADARNTGSVYCVAPLVNKWSALEPVVQFFAAGLDCCGEKGGSFGCGEGGRGAVLIATQETAPTGYLSAVAGAAAKHGLSPATGYVLLNMVQDPMDSRQSLWSNAVKITLIFIVVYFLISLPIGYMAHNTSKGGSKF